MWDIDQFENKWEYTTPSHHNKVNMTAICHKSASAIVWALETVACHLPLLSPQLKDEAERAEEGRRKRAASSVKWASDRYECDIPSGVFNRSIEFI